MTPEENRQHNGRFWILFCCSAANALLGIFAPALGAPDAQDFALLCALLCGVAMLVEYFVWG